MELDDDDYEALGYTRNTKLPTRQTLQNKKDVPHIKGAGLKVLINTLVAKYKYKQITVTRDELKLIIHHLRGMLKLKQTLESKRASKNSTTE